jgi:hypothetical protein
MNPIEQAPPARGRAAILVDFENIYYHFKNQYPTLNDPQECVLEVVRRLRDTLRTDYQLDTLVLNAYADFERIGSASQLGAFYLMGATTRNVLGTQHKNAADMQLCIDALEVMYTRADIRTFVFLAGDRDYIPVIQHLHRQARQVKVVGFKESISGDLLQIMGKENWMDAQLLLSEDRRRSFAIMRQIAEGVIAKQVHNQENRQVVQLLDQVDHQSHEVPVAAQAPAPVPVAERAQVYHVTAPNTTFKRVEKIEVENVRLTLSIILREYERYQKDVWLSPFLRLLTDKIPQVPNFERRSYITSLEMAGAVAIEMRPGEPHAYSVIVLNPSHPDVKLLLAEPAVLAH